MIFANSYYKLESRKLKAERILRSAFLHIHTKNKFLWDNRKNSNSFTVFLNFVDCIYEGPFRLS